MLAARPNSANWDGGTRTSAATAAAASGAGLLQLLIPADCAGRVIGKKGQNIQELQSRTGARVQLSDFGADEKLMEVAGPRQSVDDASALLVNDIARFQKSAPLQSAAPRSSRLGSGVTGVELTALVPEELADWVSELALEPE
ncbi:unnamed protein product, partial [Polarella glacialis]